MFNFNLRKSILGPAIFGEIFFRFFRFLRNFFLGVFFLFFLSLLYHFFVNPFPEEIISKIFGFLLIFFVAFIAVILQELFYELKLKNPKPKISLSKVILASENYNLADFLSFEAGQCIQRAFGWARAKKLLPLSGTVLFYFLLQNEESKFIFLRAGLNREEIKKELLFYFKTHSSKLKLDSKNRLFSQDFQKIILEALKIAAKKEKTFIGVGDLIYALSKIDPYFKKILISFNLKDKEIGNLVRFQEDLKEKIAKKKSFWKSENLALITPIGRGFTAGYTITLDKFSDNWTDIAMKEIGEKIIGHEQEVEELERILSRSTLNNVLLVGEPGSHRKEIIKYFAKKSYTGQSFPVLNHKKVIALDLSSLIAQIETLEQEELVLDRIFREVRTAGNIILVIDEFHDYVVGKARPGVLDISGLLISYLSKSEFQLIAITSYTGLHRSVEQNPSFLNYFSKVEVKELSEQETLQVLEERVPYFEIKYKKIILYSTLQRIVSLAARYLPDTAFPKKAIDLLDEIFVSVSEKTERAVILPADVDKVVTEKTEIPVGKLEQKEAEVLLNLEKLLHTRIINQEKGVSEISKALRRARTEITIRKGPMGSFLFLGSTGVGKTETSKALAEIYFGSESRMIRLDMSEFQSMEDIPRLMGSVGQEGLLITPVRENPFSLILLDEIEKAHPNVLNLFLQVLDEGFLTDGMGRKIDFQNTIIIATSNAGAEIIWEDVRKNKKLNIIKEELFSFFFKEKVFRPEFLNRFDGVVIFTPLTRSNLVDIADILLEKLKKNLKEKEITFLASPSIKEKIVDLGYNPTFGARDMKRVVQDKIENILAIALLQKKIQKGDIVQMDVKTDDEFKISINP